MLLVAVKSPGDYAFFVVLTLASQLISVLSFVLYEIIYDYILASSSVLCQTVALQLIIIGRALLSFPRGSTSNASEKSTLEK